MTVDLWDVIDFLNSNLCFFKTLCSINGGGKHKGLIGLLMTSPAAVVIHKGPPENWECVAAFVNPGVPLYPFLPSAFSPVGCVSSSLLHENPTDGDL